MCMVNKAKAIYEKILLLEKMYGEDFYDLGGGSIAMSEAIDNLLALKYLKEKMPLTYKTICISFKNITNEDLDDMIINEDVNINNYAHDYIFIFDKINDKNIYKEFMLLSKDNEEFSCYESELWKAVIAILASKFENIEKVLEEIFKNNEV